MTRAKTGSDPCRGTGAWFSTTRWNVVLTAGQESSPEAAAAREELCMAYWEPLYTFIRRQGNSVHDAQDLTQAFLCHLLARNSFAGLDPGKGLFRTFMLQSLKHFLADEHRRATALKRGGGQAPFPLDLDAAENRYLQIAAAESPPEAMFDRRWAEALMDQAYRGVEAKYAGARKAALFERLKPFLARAGEPGSYASLASQLGLTEAAVSVAVHRLRRRYRQLIYQAIAQTVSHPTEAKEELRYLLRVLTI